MTGFDGNNIIKETVEQADRHIRQAYAACIEKGQFPSGFELQGSIKLTRDAKLGDIACSYAIPAAKQLGLLPLKIAKAICSCINLDGSYFYSVEAAANGFINFKLSDKWYAAVLARIEGAGGGFGYTSEGRGKSLLLKFIKESSVDTITINDGRGLVLLEVLASILERAGYKVCCGSREHYATDSDFDRVIVIQYAGRKNPIDLDTEASKLEHIRYEAVRLVKSGKQVTGNEESYTELLSGLPGHAERFFLSAHPSSTVTLDMDLIRRIDGLNPLYYIKYAHARTLSLIKALKTEGFKLPAAVDIDISLLSTEADKELIKRLASFPEEVRLAARELEPPRLSRYLTELAAAFYRFYKTERIKGANPELTGARFKLLESVRIIIENGLNVLGVSIS